MAQLVKMLDYVSRYEQDLSRYPTQYIRLKKYQWERMRAQWENGADLSEWHQRLEEEPEELEDERWYSPIFRLFGQRKKVVEEEIEFVALEKDEDIDIEFNPRIIYNPTTLEQLKKLYIDQLFHFQIKWASSTLLERSRVEPRIMRDSLLRSFAQQLPDNYLLFYYPILLLKKAPIELDVIIVTPTECMCITVLEEEDVAAFVGGGERFWIKKSGEVEKKLLNPLISLSRMEKIISGLFKVSNIEFPVKKYLLSRNGYIDYPGASFDVTMIDRRTYQEWFIALQKSTVPMKFQQFKAAQAILDVGQTTANSRLFEVDEGRNDEQH